MQEICQSGLPRESETGLMPHSFSYSTVFTLLLIITNHETNHERFGYYFIDNSFGQLLSGTSLI